MQTYADKTQGKINQSSANAVSQKQNGSESTYQFVDNRPEAVSQRKLQAMNNNSLQATQAAQLQAISNKNSAQQQLKSIQKNENNTGLPDNLKTGIENLSRYSMDDVKVHFNSLKPVRLNAHAYAQGIDIHLAPRQEKHLPHEAWHVVQQKQGRVNPTVQAKGVSINDNIGLEREADLMGKKALTILGTQQMLKFSDGIRVRDKPVANMTPGSNHVLQKMVTPEHIASSHPKALIEQLSEKLDKFRAGGGGRGPEDSEHYTQGLLDILKSPFKRNPRGMTVAAEFIGFIKTCAIWKKSPFPYVKKANKLVKTLVDNYVGHLKDEFGAFFDEEALMQILKEKLESILQHAYGGGQKKRKERFQKAGLRKRGP